MSARDRSGKRQAAHRDAPGEEVVVEVVTVRRRSSSRASQPVNQFSRGRRTTASGPRAAWLPGRPPRTTRNAPPGGARKTPYLIYLAPASAGPVTPGERRRPGSRPLRTMPMSFTRTLRSLARTPGLHGSSGLRFVTSASTFSTSVSIRSSALTPRPFRPETSTNGRPAVSSGVGAVGWWGTSRAFSDVIPRGLRSRQRRRHSDTRLSIAPAARRSTEKSGHCRAAETPQATWEPPGHQHGSSAAGARVSRVLGQASRNGPVVHLEPKAMEVLVALARSRGAVLSRQTLIDAVWPGTLVEDHAVTRAVSQLRQARGWQKGEGLEIMPKRGYRLTAPVRDAPNDPGGPAAGAASPAPSSTPQPPTQPPRGHVSHRPLAVSADGQWVAFWANGALKKEPLAGGLPIGIAASRVLPFGLAWDTRGNLYFDGADKRIDCASPSSGLKAVSVEDGYTRGAGRDMLPSLSPDGNVLVYTQRKREVHRVGRRGGRGAGYGHGGSEAAAEGRGRCAVRLPRHLVFMRRGTMFGVAFDPDAVKVVGPEVPLLDGVSRAAAAGHELDATGAGRYAVASTGTLAWIPGPAPAYPERELVWVYRHGVVSPTGAPRVSGWGPPCRLTAAPPQRGAGTASSCSSSPPLTPPGTRS